MSPQQISVLISDPMEADAAVPGIHNHGNRRWFSESSESAAVSMSEMKSFSSSSPLVDDVVVSVGPRPKAK